jgi:retron-type reverse transcriptase
MKIQFNKTYEDIISLDNLLLAWQEFVCGKRKKKDVQLFEKELMMNLNNLHKDLAARIYRHSNYIAFNISDPKPRNIHKAVVRDRVLHHAIYRQMYPFFDRTFVADSYSCRNGKGLHKALNCFREFGRKVSKNNTRTVWVLKCDIKRFFASINHKMLLGILDSYIPDKNVLWLLKKVIESFKT